MKLIGYRITQLDESGTRVAIAGGIEYLADALELGRSLGSTGEAIIVDQYSGRVLTLEKAAELLAE